MLTYKIIEAITFTIKIPLVKLNRAIVFIRH